MTTIKGYNAEGALIAERDTSGDVESPEDRPKLAHQISIVMRRGKGKQRYSFAIDGKEFPWFVSDDGLSVTTSSGRMPAVTVTILADSVTVVDEFDDADG